MLQYVGKIKSFFMLILLLDHKRIYKHKRSFCAAKIIYDFADLVLLFAAKAKSIEFLCSDGMGNQQYKSRREPKMV